MSIDDIKMNITAKEREIANLISARAYYAEHFGYQITQIEQDIYNLNIQLQLAEADEAFAYSYSDQLTDLEEPCYSCGRAVYACICVYMNEDIQTDLLGEETQSDLLEEGELIDS
jgi:hypothetical protein